jgi:hypothetical protein
MQIVITMQQKKKQITARIPEDLYYKCNALYPNVTDAVIAGLELLCTAECNADRNASEVNCNAECNAERNADESTIIGLRTQIENKDTLIQSLEVRASELHNRIGSLEGQLNVKDSQLEKQAVHIQTLINQKAIEAPGAKKQWWRFW